MFVAPVFTICFFLQQSNHQVVAVSEIMWVNIKSFIVYRTIIPLGEIW